MKHILILVLFLGQFSNASFAQDDGYLSLAELIKLKGLTNEKVYDYISVKGFEYIGRDEVGKQYLYALHYNRDTEIATHWLNVWDNNHISYQTTEVNGKIIEKSLAGYKYKTEFLDNRIRTRYKYKTFQIFISVELDRFNISVYDWDPNYE